MLVLPIAAQRRSDHAIAHPHRGAWDQPDDRDHPALLIIIAIVGVCDVQPWSASTDRASFNRSRTRPDSVRRTAACHAGQLTMTLGHPARPARNGDLIARSLKAALVGPHAGLRAREPSSAERGRFQALGRSTGASTRSDSRCMVQSDAAMPPSTRRTVSRPATSRDAWRRANRWSDSRPPRARRASARRGRCYA